ncbi:ribose-phosphate pyrophosphokinase [Alsobacter soli]|uniref:ribose-phosphate diphosphokinase n=2 Tax=Alsobacter soli TaxID=2109933 RepID=A0A2T1HVD8_9HYPH|nr:ribose-phosphate pyrophosphokinase [Alsobacter soli]
MAVRLRRLAETVVSRGEPLRAWADAAGPSREGVEWLVLPLSSDGVRVDAVVGAIALGQPAPSRRGRGGKTPAQTDEPLLFALNASQAFGRSLADALGLALAAHEERDFEDGEHKARPLCDVAGRTAVLVQSLHGDDAQSVNDKLCRMLFFTGALKDSGARRVLLVAPYLCYARKDRRTKLHDPVTTRYLGQLFEAMGADGIATVEVHNQAAFENAFRIPKLHVEQTGALLPYLLRIASGDKLAVVSPDSGGMKRAEALRLALEDATRQPVSKAFMEKQRSMGQVWGDLFAGDVAGRTAVIVDDMISTGGSMARTAEECRRRGAARVICAAAHGLFAEGAPALFASPVDRIAVTDTVELPSALRRAPPGNLDVIGVAPTVAASLSPWLG